jgi:nicotinamide-nucleotide amidase
VTAPHDRAAILSIGDELAIGQSLDTNAMWIAERCTARGIRVVEHRTVADDLAELTRAITELAARVPVVIATGGLGPTADDLTRQALADAMRESLVEDPQALARLEEIERTRGRTLTPQRRAQALRPMSARCIPNPNGTAPGLAATIAAERHACDVFFLPGPPREMHPMFDAFVAPALRPPGGRVVRTRLIRTFGLPEADAGARLGDLMRRDANPLIGTTASGGIVTVRIRAEGEAAWADAATDTAEAAVLAAVGDFVFATGERTLSEAVLDSLRARSERMVVAESCTSGLLGAMVGAIPGASDCFLGGYIAYANTLKRMDLGVPLRILDGPGAVSMEAAIEMAQGGLRRNPRAHHALSITGIAGPTGETPGKPVGTVFIARASRLNNSAHAPVDARRFLIAGDRDDIRERSAVTALGMLWHHLAHATTPKLLWQIAP